MFANLYRLRKIFLFSLIIIVSVISLGASSPGTIYIVIGSDTAIWDGMSTSRYNNVYNPALFINTVTNTSEIMDPSFRGRFIDSFGDTLRLTWWMMTGNIFRYAVNRDMPYPNIMTMYFMKQFYGDQIELLKDELTLHYHTFKWSDYDGDGKYWWNQAESFMESYDDFNFTIAQLFLEEEVFAVSFRSGWHYMDNDWQNYLNKLLPYSLHNDYPTKQYSPVEPTNNNIDWSLAPSEFVPYNPSPDNYQIQGESKGWNVRSTHLRTAKNSTTLLNTVFSKANAGLNQVVCIWGHLPEEDFNTNIAAVDSLLHHYQSLYPQVNFKYTTGVEAMQLYRGGDDFTPPVLTVNEGLSGNKIEFTISADEPIFQEQPFVAYKDLNENFAVVDCTPSGTNTWKAVLPVDKEFVVKAGVVLSDTMGNQSMKIIRYLPDDIFIDNTDPGYSELYGSWTHNNDYAWGNHSRKVVLGANDSAKVSWSFDITQEGFYHIFTQFPATANQAGNITFRLLSQSEPLDTIFISTAPVPKKWFYLSTKELPVGSYKVEMSAYGAGQQGKVLTADVLKVSPIVRDKAIQSLNDEITLGEVALTDSIFFNVVIRNGGTGDLIVTEVESISNLSLPLDQFPIIIGSMETYNLKFRLNVSETGTYNDTIIIRSDDPLVPALKLPFSAKVVPFFVIIDNEDTGSYTEISGIWNYSVAQAYGPTSRYAALNQNPRASAAFEKVIEKEGQYDMFFIVPVTVNAAPRTLYRVFIDGVMTDSLIIDQNINSGSWVMIARRHLEENTLVKIVVSDPGGNTGSNIVLRADAVRIGLFNEALAADEKENIPDNYYLYQNYPNPFNPITKIKYSIPAGYETKVSLVVYDVIGRMIELLVNENKSPGTYEAEFNAAGLSSGIYFCRLNAGSYTSVIKMVVLK